jgi:hypothetical protein
LKKILAVRIVFRATQPGTVELVEWAERARIDSHPSAALVVGELH